MSFRLSERPALRPRFVAAVCGAALLVFLAIAAFTAVPAQAGTPTPISSLGASDSVTPTLPPGPVVPTWAPIGYSVRGRPIQAIRFGSGTNHVVVIGGVHGTEYGYDVAHKLVKFLLANPAALPAGVQLDIIASANPDGRALRRRTNAHGVDLNRNFPARNWRRFKKSGGSSGRAPASEPETKALISFLEAGGYSRVITLHSRGPLVDYDGAGGWTLAKRFSRNARMPMFRLARTKHYYGSMGNWVPQRLHVPILTIELGNRQLPYRLRKGLFAAMQ
jgi:predicted deacylase